MNILAVCEHFLEGSCCFKDCEHFVNIFWKGATVSNLVNILAVCEHFLEGSCCFKACEHHVSWPSCTQQTAPLLAHPVTQSELSEQLRMWYMVFVQHNYLSQE